MRARLYAHQALQEPALNTSPEANRRSIGGIGGAKIEILFRGDIELKLASGKKIKLRNVAYALNSSANIFSNQGGPENNGEEWKASASHRKHPIIKGRDRGRDVTHRDGEGWSLLRRPPQRSGFSVRGSVAMLTPERKPPDERRKKISLELAHARLGHIDRKKDLRNGEERSHRRHEHQRQEGVRIRTMQSMRRGQHEDCQHPEERNKKACKDGRPGHGPARRRHC